MEAILRLLVTSVLSLQQQVKKSTGCTGKGVLGEMETSSSSLESYQKPTQCREVYSPLRLHGSFIERYHDSNDFLPWLNADEVSSISALPGMCTCTYSI